ncbi:MazG nucleotide pyrophosphohydrolase domain [Kurthia zopfii]|nr:MazG nucleotide pyrophosphohydrolase domain [Kurthia zopfii]
MVILQTTIQEILAFRKERGWHTNQDARSLAISISLEANELLEPFQWVTGEVAQEKYRQEIKEEMADVLVYLVALADHMEIDLEKAISEKLIKNAIKYPVPEKTRV